MGARLTAGSGRARLPGPFWRCQGTQSCPSHPLLPADLGVGQTGERGRRGWRVLLLGLEERAPHGSMGPGASGAPVLGERFRSQVAGTLRGPGPCRDAAVGVLPGPCRAYREVRQAMDAQQPPGPPIGRASACRLCTSTRAPCVPGALKFRQAGDRQGSCWWPPGWEGHLLAGLASQVPGTGWLSLRRGLTSQGTFASAAPGPGPWPLTAVPSMAASDPGLAKGAHLLLQIQAPRRGDCQCLGGWRESLRALVSWGAPQGLHPGLLVRCWWVVAGDGHRVRLHTGRGCCGRSPRTRPDWSGAGGAVLWPGRVWRGPGRVSTPLIPKGGSWTGKSPSLAYRKGIPIRSGEIYCDV